MCDCLQPSTWVVDRLTDFGEPLSDHELAWIQAEVDTEYLRHLDDETERETRLDTRDRLRGRCDVCSEWPTKGTYLQIDGGIATCLGCTQQDAA